MSKKKLKIADRNDIFLYMTRVENLFINEFLPSAPGEYVKVYIFALMYAQYEEEIDSLKLARILGMEEHEVEEAWTYWEAGGLINISDDGSTIEFNRMVERLYGKNRVIPPHEEVQHPASTDAGFDDEETDSYYDFDSEDVSEGEEGDTRTTERSIVNEQLRMLFSRFQEVSGRTISRKETEKFTDAVNIYGIKAEVLYYAIDYCADINNYNADYIFKVALRWKEEGCEDRESVKALLDKRNARSSAYREIFKAVGFSRLTTPADREIMDRWLDEMGFSLGEVLEACKATGGIREPSLRYVNKILENKMLEKGGIRTEASGGRYRHEGASEEKGGAKVSRKVLKEYYDHIREEEEKALADRIREALGNVPGLEEIYEKEKKLNSEVLSLMSSAGRERREEIREERKRLEESRQSLLAEEGYPRDFLERRYRCDICKDTGYTDEGTVCSCCRARADEAYIWNLEKNAN